MAGTKEGGMKAKATNQSLYGRDWYARIGAMGGRNGHTGGFASAYVGKDGLTGPERAKVAGAKGGLVSRRTGIKNGEGGQPHLSDEEVAIRTAEERERLHKEIKALEEDI